MSQKPERPMYTLRQPKEAGNGKTLRITFKVSILKCDRLESWRDDFGHENIAPGLVFLFILLQFKHCKMFKTILCKIQSLMTNVMQ